MKNKKIQNWKKNQGCPGCKSEGDVHGCSGEITWPDHVSSCALRQSGCCVCLAGYTATSNLYTPVSSSLFTPITGGATTLQGIATAPQPPQPQPPHGAAAYTTNGGMGPAGSSATPGAIGSGSLAHTHTCTHTPCGSRLTLRSNNTFGEPFLA